MLADGRWSGIELRRILHERWCRQWHGRLLPRLTGGAYDDRHAQPDSVCLLAVQAVTPGHMLAGSHANALDVVGRHPGERTADDDSRYRLLEIMLRTVRTVGSKGRMHQHWVQLSAMAWIA